VNVVKSYEYPLAPQVQPDIRDRFPALTHLDGTARHQSVAKTDEAWLHALLIAVGKKTGLPALINTSFNSRGKPITNTVKASLEMLSELSDLDYVLIEDWLFKKNKHAISYHPPKQEVVVTGNSECWFDGFNYDMCCDSKFGQSGNSQCWDGVFNYDRCCFARIKL